MQTLRGRFACGGPVISMMPPPTRRVHFLRLSSSSFPSSSPLSSRTPHPLLPPSSPSSLFPLKATAAAYHTTPPRELPRRDRDGAAKGSAAPPSSSSSSSSPPSKASKPKKAKPMLDQLLAEYEGLEFLGTDHQQREDEHEDDTRVSVRRTTATKDRPRPTPASAVHPPMEGDLTLDDLLADYDDGRKTKHAGTDVPTAAAATSRGGRTESGRTADRLTSLENEFTLDDLLSAYDDEDADVDRNETKATKNAGARAASGESWEQEWRQDMDRFGGASERPAESTLEDLVKAYQPPTDRPRSRTEPRHDDVAAEDTTTATTSTTTTRERVRQELRRFAKGMVAEDLGLALDEEVNEAEQALPPLGKASRDRPATNKQTRTRAEEEKEEEGAVGEDGVKAAELVAGEGEEGDDEDEGDDYDEEEEDIQVDMLQEYEGKEGQDKMDDASLEALLDEEAENDEEEDRRLTRELEEGRGVLHPLEFSPLWRAASKHLPPRRTREEWERLGDDGVEPAFAGIERSERELEGVEVLKRYDAVNENETDEQYMERMIRAEEEAEMAGSGKPKTKTAKKEAKPLVDLEEEKKAKIKLKRKERRRQEHEQYMEKVKRHHKEANVKLVGAQMFAHGANSKRDVQLEKKCRKLQRMAELRKSREKRIDSPGDPSTAEVEELLGMTRRQKRMASKIHDHLEDVLIEDLRADSALAQVDISINEVVMSRDMRIARVYWKGSGNEDAAERLLHARTPMLRGMLAHRAGVRFAPELVFHREGAESMYHEVSRYMDQLQKQEGWDEATIKTELKRIRKEREAGSGNHKA